MAELNKGSIAANKAWSSEQEIVDYDVDNNEEEREKDISDEVSFYRQTKFSKTDAENITKKAFGDSALKRPDKLGAYKEISTLSPDIQNLWKKIENKRIRGKSQISYAHNLLKKEGIAEKEKTKLESDIDALDERDAAFEDIENIILKEKNPNEILKAIQNSVNTYKAYQQEFQKQIEEQSDDIRAQAGLRRLNIGINILLNFKNAISNIINEEKNMTSKESSIIDSESKINDEENPIEGGGIEQKESLQEVIEASESEIVNTQGDIQKEAENNDANIEQKSEGIKDPVVKNQIRADAQKPKNKVISGGIRISEESLEKLNGIKNGQKSETEAKNPEISAQKEQIKGRLKKIESELKVFENGKKEEVDVLVGHMIQEGRAKQSEDPKAVKGYLENGLRDQKNALYRAKALLDQSQSPEEFYQKLQDEIDKIKINQQKELDEISAENIDEEKKKDERKIINNKYNFRKGVFGSYLPTKQEIKPEPTGEPQEPKPVEPKIDAKLADVQPDSQPNRNERDEIVAAYDQRIENLRLGADEARQAGKEDRAKELEGFARDAEQDKNRHLKRLSKEGKKGKIQDKTQKPSEPVSEPTTSVDAQSSSKNPTELENDEAEAKLKTNGPVYGKESTPEDAQEDAEKIKNRKKVEEEKKSADESKEEFRRAPDEPKSETGKEKTPEDILREKNIELYGGPEKFNKIIDAYQKLNELVDNKADSVDDKGKPLNEKLFKEWDELRINLAGKKIVIMDEKMGIKSIHGKYEIKNPEEKIRKFYDKLNEPVEAFAADSAEDTIIRAATLAKHRNELAERLSRAKNANLEVQIKDLDKKIEVLNEKMGERRDPSKPEISIANLLINNFEKAGNKESVEEKLNKEAEEIESELENTPKEERKKLGLGIRTFGFFLQEQKSKGLAKMCEWLSGVANKASGQELNSAGKVKSIETAGSMTRFLASLSETYRRDEKRARQGIDQDPETLKQGTWRQLQNAGFLSGNILKYGRTVADVAGWTAGSPLRWFMIGSQLFTRGAEAAKYARLKNADVINKTRLGFEKIEGATPEQMKEYEQAVDEAYKIYEQAKESAVRQGGEKVTNEAIEQAYLEQLPQDILNRMKKAEPGAATGIVERIGQKAFQKYVELSIKAGKFTKIGFQKRLKEYDAMISKYGTVDALAMSAKLAETAGKTVIAATTVETAYLALKNLPVIFERIENAGSGTTGSGHGIFSGLKEAIVGKRILSHDGGAPGGGGRSEKSFFGAFADNQSRDHDMFSWEKPTTYSSEIPIGQGSFTDRFLRAVGMHEGSPVKPELQKIVAGYSEYFKHHPELIKTQGAGNKDSLEFFSHLKSDLQNAGLDGRAADEIVKNFSFEMGKVGTGYYPEGDALPGIETTGAGTGAGAGGSAAENTITAAGAGKTIDAVIGAKQDIVNSAVETASGKMNSVWKMIDHQLDQRGIFKGLTGTPEEIAAKKTYMIDYFKDIVAKDPKGFGLKDIDDLRVGQKVDLSKLFESHPRLGEIIRDTNVLSADKLSSIYEHDQTIAEFHRLHPDIHITSENVDQIAAGHGDALLKKAVEQAADQTAVAAPIDTVVPQKPPVVNKWHDFGGKKPEFKSPIDDLGFKEAQVDKIASEKIGDRLNKIFDYTFGKQGAETSTYQNVKNEVADNFLKRKLSGEVDVNDPFAIDRDDARRYGELQEYLKELAKENNSAPKTGETVAEFIKRAASKAARGEVGKAMESPIDKKSELI